MGNTISFQYDDDGVATLVIDIKDRRMNVLTPKLLEELHFYVEKVASDSAIQGAIITSGKDSIGPFFLDFIGLLRVEFRNTSTANLPFQSASCQAERLVCNCKEFDVFSMSAILVFQNLIF